METIRATFSVCPICLKRIKARLKTDGTVVRLVKQCDEHGEFSCVVWRGEPGLLKWMSFTPEMKEPVGCPSSCGLCSEHIQSTCCLLLELTSRCNLECPHCFAESSATTLKPDPSLEVVKKWVSEIAATGRAFLQLSGGEPTLRDDLPQIIRHAKESGCEYVQLNSNGLRLAEDEAYVAALAQAGLSFVFMQFDGTNDDIYTKLRGRKLLETKLMAIDICGRHNIGVTLVPTVVPGVNDCDIGNIIRLAVERSPLVRGVHFQPISYFGRYPLPPQDASRITLPEVLAGIYEQTGDLVPNGSLAASSCDHPRCGFHGAYIKMPDATLKAFTKAKEGGCCPTPLPAENNRHFVGLRWQRPNESCCGNKASIPMLSNRVDKVLDDINTLDGFLARAKSHSFTISAMAFQDAYTLDLERLRQCSLHVFDNGRKVPFCAYYIGTARSKQLNGGSQ